MCTRLMALGKSSGANEVNHPHSTITAEIKKIYIYVQTRPGG